MAAQLLLLLAGFGVVETITGRGVLVSSERTSASRGITSLINPGGVLDPPLARRMVDAVSPSPVDSTPYRVTLGGKTREFRLHLAGDAAPTSPRPLIVVLPGLYLSASDSERHYGFDELSNMTGATVAYVNGVRDSWDAGTCCGYAAAQKLDDVGALHVIVDSIATLVRVDRRHVVLAGFSNGGMLAYRAACAQSDQLAGVIIASGSLQVGDCNPGPLSLVVSSGARDTVVPAQGVTYSEFLKGPVTSMTASLAPFEAADACTARATRRVGRYSITQLRSCASGVLVTSYVDRLGGHTWVGKVPVRDGADGLTFARAAWQQLGGRASVVPFRP